MLDRDLIRRINEFIDAQIYDWSDVDLNVEAKKCAKYLTNYGWIEGNEYTINNLVNYFVSIKRDVEFNLDVE